MKKLTIMSMAALLGLAASGLSSCGGSSSGGSISGNVSSTADPVEIGILQVITHDALNSDRQGFIDELASEGFVDGQNIKITVQIPEGDSSTETSMATNLVTNSDMVFGIATSSSLALKNAAEDLGKDMPVLFSAVTDPVGAGLVTSFTDHGNVVGTSDAGPTDKNIALFKDFDSISKIGIIYNSAESNSVVQKNEAQAACDSLGLTLVDGGFTSASEIETVLQGMIAKGIKGLFVPTDNTVAAAMSSIKDIVDENKIVTVCADSNETANGGSLGYSVDYHNLGETTGKMAAEILKGTDISTIECSKSDSFPLSVNSDFFTSTGIAIPAAIQAILDQQEA